MPSPVTSSNSWMPSHYTSLSDACLTHAGSEHVTPMSWGMSIKQGPKAYVEHLSSAASKYRLASLCNGLKGPDPEAIGNEAIGNDYFDKYSAQAIIMLSYVAFETHLRMLNLERSHYKLDRAGVDCQTISERLREEFAEASFSRLKKAMDNQRLKGRMEDFWAGNDCELLAVVSALRNSFSHGKMGITHTLKLDFAIELKSYLLELIKADAELIIKSLVSQDTRLLPDT